MVGGLDQLHEDPLGGSGVQKGHQVAPSPRAGYPVDELETFALQASQGFRQVRYPVRNVVESLAPFVQKASDGGVGSKGLQKLNGADEANSDPLSGELFRRGGGLSGEELEEGASLPEGGHGHGNVVKWECEHVIFGAWVRTIRTPEDA
jgi:hypothetical protein